MLFELHNLGHIDVGYAHLINLLRLLVRKNVLVLGEKFHTIASSKDKTAYIIDAKMCTILIDALQDSQSMF